MENIQLSSQTEPTNAEIMKTVSGLTQIVSGLTQTTSGLTTSVSEITQTVSSLAQTTSKLVETVSGLTQSVLEIVETVSGLTQSVLEIKESVEELREAMHVFSNDVQQQFDEVKSELKSYNTRLTKVEALMVTKEYLDDKLADLQGDLTILMRKEDTKLKALVEILIERRVLTPEDRKRIIAMEPFPELVL